MKHLSFPPEAGESICLLVSAKGGSAGAEKTPTNSICNFKINGTGSEHI